MNHYGQKLEYFTHEISVEQLNMFIAYMYEAKTRIEYIPESSIEEIQNEKEKLLNLYKGVK